GDRLAGARHAAQPQEPARVATGFGVPQPDDAQHARRPQPAVPARHRLVGHAENLGDSAERGAAVHAEALRELPVEVVDREDFHRSERSQCRDPAHRRPWSLGAESAREISDKNDTNYIALPNSTDSNSVNGPLLVRGLGLGISVMSYL